MDDRYEERLKKLIVETLALEDVSPGDIVTDAPLFGEGLGLDSIDALELALAIHSEFGVRADEGDPKNREYFHSVKSLAEWVRTKQASTGTIAARTAVPAASPE
jgi:acyl carrier protein